MIKRLWTTLLLTLAACADNANDPNLDSEENSIASYNASSRIALAAVGNDREVGWCYLVEDPTIKSQVIPRQSESDGYTLRQYKRVHNFAIAQEALDELVGNKSRDQANASESLRDEVASLLAERNIRGVRDTLCDVRGAMSATSELLSTLDRLFGRTALPNKETTQRAVQCNNGEATIRKKPTATLSDASYKWLAGKLRTMATKHSLRSLRCPSTTQEYDTSVQKP
jgi:hypothetical protein